MMSKTSSDTLLKACFIRKSHYYLISILLNDIEDFINRHELFLDDHAWYKDEQNSLYLQRNSQDSVALKADANIFANSNNSAEDNFYIEGCKSVADALKDVLYNIKLIDYYRVSGNDLLIDELLKRVGNIEHICNNTNDDSYETEYDA